MTSLKQTNKQMLEELLERTGQAPLINGAVGELSKTMAVLVDGMRRVETQLGKQNGFLRKDHEGLTRHTEQIEGLRKDRDEDRGILKELVKRVRGLELTTTKLLVTGGIGSGIGLGGWLLIRYLTTGQIVP